jgi:preprotein translocase subunit SecA
VQYIQEAFVAKATSADMRLVDTTMRMIYLSTIDKYWVDHIDAMQYLRDKVGLY